MANPVAAQTNHERKMKVRKRVGTGFKSGSARQKGVALLMVLFVFALVTVLAGAIISRQTLFIQKSGYSLHQSQAYEIALGAEAYARQILFNDWEEDKEEKEFSDHLGEVWGEYSATLPIDYGVIEVQVDDLQGKLNLNDLVDADGKFNELTAARFKNLLNVLEIEALKVDALKDWIDQDSETSGFDGAEDGVYLGSDIPYRAANQPFYSTSELMLINGMTIDIYEKMLPFVTALPQGTTGVNVNTCPIEIIRSLPKKPITSDQAQSIVDDRAEKPFDKLDKFLTRPEFANMELDPKGQGLSVKTEFFQMSARVTFSERTSRLVSVIYRAGKDGKMATYRRDQGRKYLITKDQVLLK